MPNPRDLTRQPLPDPVLLSATVTKAPATLSDELQVVVHARTPERATQIRGWMPRDALLPAKGDVALVAFDENDEPWLVAFIPSA